MIMLNTRVRPAVNGDAAQMVTLLNAIIAVGGTTAHQTPLDIAAMRAHYIAPPTLICCHVAISNGRLSGFQFLGWDNSRDGWAIIASFVTPDRAQMGIGQKLFSATRFAAKAAHVKTIDATIRADNMSGLKYYSGLGFDDYDTLSLVPLHGGTPIDRIRKQFDL
tara:strand:+ start:90564 stop:91055 length:492 start_codon:yes stop_codon:yes gene_type:complete